MCEPYPTRLAGQPVACDRFRGHHGGLHPDEMDTWVGALELGGYS
jgi:hypothetical protein